MPDIGQTQTDDPRTPAQSAGSAAHSVVAEDLQTAMSDLARLQRLLAEAALTMGERFISAADALSNRPCSPGAFATPCALPAFALGELRLAITALQVHDMGNQLIEHTYAQLQRCADRLGEHETAAMCLLPLVSPVEQQCMRSGSIELF